MKNNKLRSFKQINKLMIKLDCHKMLNFTLKKIKRN